jgi:hypothetical protein
MIIAQSLNRQLPSQYVASPHVHLGRLSEIDVASFETNGDLLASPPDRSTGGVAIAAWAPPAPTVDVVVDLEGQDEYEVRVYDVERERRLVAAVEIISPSNKDRPDSRQEFVAKCAALLRAGVSVAIVDLVTVRRFNLYAELLDHIGQVDPTLGADRPGTYAAECRWARKMGTGRLQTWSHTLVVGQPLPVLPLWIADNLPVQLDLESTYEDTCRSLRIG